jgi:hypothetical protein
MLKFEPFKLLLRQLKGKTATKMLEPSEYITLGEPVTKMTLGIIGKREDIYKEDLHEKVINPLLKALGQMPDKIILPNEGTSTALLGIWGERAKLPVEQIAADWARYNRMSFKIRDARIVKESTILLLFQGPKSEYIPKLGIREVKKGKRVFVVNPGKDWKLEEWV